MGQERQGPSYLFISIVLGPLKTTFYGTYLPQSILQEQITNDFSQMISVTAGGTGCTYIYCCEKTKQARQRWPTLMTLMETLRWVPGTRSCRRNAGTHARMRLARSAFLDFLAPWSSTHVVVGATANMFVGRD